MANGKVATGNAGVLNNEKVQEIEAWCMCRAES